MTSRGDALAEAVEKALESMRNNSRRVSPPYPFTADMLLKDALRAYRDSEPSAASHGKRFDAAVVYADGRWDWEDDVPPDHTSPIVSTYKVIFWLPTPAPEVDAEVEHG